MRTFQSTQLLYLAAIAIPMLAIPTTAAADVEVPRRISKPPPVETVDDWPLIETPSAPPAKATPAPQPVPMPARPPKRIGWCAVLVRGLAGVLAMLAAYGLGIRQVHWIRSRSRVRSDPPRLVGESYKGWRGGESTCLVYQFLDNDPSPGHFAASARRLRWNLGDKDQAAESLALTLRDHVYNETPIMVVDKIWTDLVYVALEQVDWRELADHLIANTEADR
jgi:hypothetical protein